MTKLTTLVFTALVAILATHSSAHAQISGNGSAATDSVREVIPYRGHLDVGGQVYDGLADFQFTIYGAASGGSPLWTSSVRTGVRVYAGEFEVDLGSIGPNFLALSSATADTHPLFQTDTLFVAASVVLYTPNPTPTIPLAGRQRLVASPYAMTARQAESLSLTSNLAVGGALTCGTATFTGASSQLQGVTVAGAFTANALTSVGSLTVDTNLIATHYRQHSESAGCTAGTVGCASRGFAVIDTAVIAYNGSTSTLSIFVPSGATALCGLKRESAHLYQVSGSAGGGCTIAPSPTSGGTTWTLTASQGANPFADAGDCQMSCLVLP